MRVSMTGIGRYTYELAKGLRDSKLLTEIKFQFLLGWVDDPESLIQKYHSGDKAKEGSAPNKVKQTIHHVARSIFWSISPTVKGLICLPYRKDFMYHSPSFVLPHFAGKCVSTVHDLSAFRVPQYHPQVRVKYQQDIFPHLIKKGDLLITDSEFSRSELLDFFPMSAERVVSVPLGADPMFAVRAKEAIEPTLGQYGLQAGTYTLSVGTIEPRKNIERLIDVYASLPSELRKQYPLVLVGGRGWNSEQIHQKIQRYRQEGWLKYLSFVPNEDLAAIYSGARVFACISHYEGFGLPVLEAMASGIPVISSNAASLPEVGGDAVVYVNPNDEEQIREALMRVLGDDVLCQDLSIRGLKRSQVFSWERCAQMTIEAYRQIA
jgi:glycosyltransferase involved in cell wall biosynthesis